MFADEKETTKKLDTAASDKPDTDGDRVRRARRRAAEKGIYNTRDLHPASEPIGYKTR